MVYCILLSTGHIFRTTTDYMYNERGTAEALHSTEGFNYPSGTFEYMGNMIIVKAFSWNIRDVIAQWRENN